MTATEEHEVATWRDVFQFVVNGRITFLAAAILGSVIGLFYYMTAERLYISDAVLQSAPSTDQATSSLNSIVSRLGSVASIAGLEPSFGSKHDEALAVLKSRGFFSEVDAAVRFSDALRSRRKQTSLMARFLDSPLSTGEAYEAFHRDVMSVVDDKGRTTLRLRIRWNDPKIASSWANRIIELLNSRMRLAAISESARNLSFLEKELQGTTLIETRQAIAFLIQRETERRMYANVTQDFGLRVIDSAFVADPEDFSSPSLVLCLLTGSLVGIAFVALFLLSRDSGGKRDQAPHS